MKLLVMQIVISTPMMVLTAQDLSTFQPLTALKTVALLFMSAIALIGYIIVGKSLMEISTAIQQNDNAGVSSGLKGLLGGGIMAAISTLMTILGFVI